jgi:hypothetical protein
MNGKLHKIKSWGVNLYDRLNLSMQFEAGAMAFVISLYVFRMSVPYLKYIFIPAITIFIIYSLLKLLKTNRSEMLPTLQNLRWFVPFGLVVFFFFIGVFRSTQITPFVLKELINVGVILVILFLLMLYIKVPEDYERFKGEIARFFLIFAVLISILGLLKFTLLLKGIEWEFLKQGERYPWGSSLMHDYNFFSLGSLLGIGVLIFFYFRRRNGLWLGLLYHASFLLMFYNVIWSGSRRGFVSLIILVSIIVVLRIFFFFRKQRASHPNLIHNFNLLILTIGFSILMATYFFKYYPYEKKEQLIEKLQFDEEITKNEIAKITYRHLNIMNIPRGLNSWYDELWGFNYIQVEEDILLPANKQPFSYEAEDLISKEKAKVYHSRTDRWKYARNLFWEKYSASEKMFGKGFDYLVTFNEALW